MMLPIKLMGTSRVKENVIEIHSMSQNLQELVVKKRRGALIQAPPESHQRSVNCYVIEHGP